MITLNNRTRAAVGLLVLTVLISPAVRPASELPVTGTAERPALLLDLGSRPESLNKAVPGIRAVQGEAVSHDPQSGLQMTADELSSTHPGFGHWNIAFRFPLPNPASALPYHFWARWRQGGDPQVCEQNFQVWAGPAANRLELRASVRLKPKGWKYAWLTNDTPVTLRAEDKWLEIRNSGAGHDAKVFDAFLLGPPAPPPQLPAIPSEKAPLLLLELGSTPPRPSAPGLTVYQGDLSSYPGANSANTAKDEVQVLHPGFGQWGANLDFQLEPAPKPGAYRFFARYKSGGEVSQVAQEFLVKAGPDRAKLGVRGRFTLSNDTPWEYQWLAGASSFNLLPGDRFLAIENQGKADGAKVFDAFLLQMAAPAPSWMTLEDALARSEFLAQIQPRPSAERRLFVLDGPGPAGTILFKGLGSAAARESLETLQTEYLLGEQALALAEKMKIGSLPAVIITDAQNSMLGVLNAPRTIEQVGQFLADPRAHGRLPALADTPAPESDPLREGYAKAWLVGGIQDGPAGLSIYGVDSETVLRPNPQQAYIGTRLMGGELRRWEAAPTDEHGQTPIQARIPHTYAWSKGSGYGQLYLKSDGTQAAVLRLSHSGERSAVWLDGVPLNEEPSPAISGPSGSLPQVPQAVHSPRQVRLIPLGLSPGWHSLLVKIVTAQREGEALSFSARLLDTDGKPLSNLATRLSDPAANLSLNGLAARLRPLIYAEAPANLPHPGEALRIRADMRWHPVQEERTLTEPISGFQGKLRLRLCDYSGQEIAAREVAASFPSEVSVDFGAAPEAGYYLIYPSLYAADGRLIMAYGADGFSVVKGSAAQRERLQAKKLWNNFYYAFAEGDKGFQQEGGYFAWLQRMGIYRSYGAYPGFDRQREEKWRQAKEAGLEIFADSAGDSHWLNDSPDKGLQFVHAAAQYTRYFKASNEIDIQRDGQWAKLRDPAHWVERARWEHEAIHAARPDGLYVGGSLVRPGDRAAHPEFPGGLGPGRWFEEVLKLGLDRYQDAWDVHAYPQRPPRFGEPLGNGPDEDERGVLAAYARLGKTNTLPFWLGEVGAKAAHGESGRRWQADQTAKMLAWANSRKDYRGIAFCIAHEYAWGQGRLWDYSMGHQPGEAALYTAGALIDGLPYEPVDTGDPGVQAARFGGTLMAWRGDSRRLPWTLRLDPGKSWLAVDVVGRTGTLNLSPTGNAEIPLTESPIYILEASEYARLTR